MNSSLVLSENEELRQRKDFFASKSNVKSLTLKMGAGLPSLEILKLGQAFLPSTYRGWKPPHPSHPHTNRKKKKSKEKDRDEQQRDLNILLWIQCWNGEVYLLNLANWWRFEEQNEERKSYIKLNVTKNS